MHIVYVRPQGGWRRSLWGGTMEAVSWTSGKHEQGLIDRDSGSRSPEPGEKRLSETSASMVGEGTVTKNLCGCNESACLPRRKSGSSRSVPPALSREKTAQLSPWGNPRPREEKQTLGPLDGREPGGEWGRWAGPEHASVPDDSALFSPPRRGGGG